MLIAAIAALGAACNLHDAVRSELSARGEVLRDWKVAADDERLILREGARVVEYRIFGTETTAVGSQVMYSVDTVTGLCFAGDSTQPVTCTALARDPDLRPYLLPSPSSSTL